MAETEVRLARPEDAAAVAALIAAFRTYYEEQEPADEVILTVVERLLRDPCTDFLLAGEPAAGVAQLRYRLSAWTGTEDAWLEDVFVLEERRRQGLGKALIEASIERARERGCARIQLDANENNDRALDLYEALGFRCGKPGRWDGGRDLYFTRWL